MINILKGGFPTISYPTPDASPDQGRNFILRDYTKALNAPFSYNATKYTLWIFNSWDTDRFNGAFRKIVGIANCETGFRNGEIQWDGRDDYGNKVQGGKEYKFILRLENCDNKCVSETSTCNETHNYDFCSNDFKDIHVWNWLPPMWVWTKGYGCGIKSERIGYIILNW